jgi:hypothetical protein
VHLTVLLAGAGPLGCAAKSVQVGFPKDMQNLARIATAYVDAEARLGRPPKDPEELKPFLADYGNPDDMLTSSNDGLPYTILWGTKVKDARRGFPLLAHEQKGKDGKRLVVDSRAQPTTMSDEQFSRRRSAPELPPSEDK